MTPSIIMTPASSTVLSCNTRALNCYMVDSNGNILPQNSNGTFFKDKVYSVLSTIKNTTIGNSIKINKVIDKKYIALDKISSFGNLADNWNGYGSDRINVQLIKKVYSIVNRMDYVPEVFPTASNSIQLEFDKSDGSYLELCISLNSKCEVYKVDSSRKEEEYTISPRINSINKVVKDFFE